MTTVLEMDPRHVRRLDRRTFLVHHDGQSSDLLHGAGGLPTLDGEPDPEWGTAKRIEVEEDLAAPGLFTVHVDYEPQLQECCGVRHRRVSG